MLSDALTDAQCVYSVRKPATFLGLATRIFELDRSVRVSRYYRAQPMGVKTYRVNSESIADEGLEWTLSRRIGASPVRQSGSNAAPDVSARRTDEPQDLATDTLLLRDVRGAALGARRSDHAVERYLDSGRDAVQNGISCAFYYEKMSDSRP